MTFITKKYLPRRTFLRGAGVAIALPLLDSMVPAQTALAQTAANPRSRLGCIYVPHGATMDKWTPAQEGKGFSFTEILQPLEKYRDRLVVVSNLAHPQAAGVGSDAGADHARSAAVFLSGAHPEKESVHVGTTIDQIVAEKLGQDTPLPSIEVASEDFAERSSADNERLPIRTAAEPGTAHHFVRRQSLRQCACFRLADIHAEAPHVDFIRVQIQPARGITP